MKVPVAPTVACHWCHRLIMRAGDRRWFHIATMSRRCETGDDATPTT